MPENGKPLIRQSREKAWYLRPRLSQHVVNFAAVHCADTEAAAIQDFKMEVLQERGEFAAKLIQSQLARREL